MSSFNSSLQMPDKDYAYGPEGPLFNLFPRVHGDIRKTSDNVKSRQTGVVIVQDVAKPTSHFSVTAKLWPHVPLTDFNLATTYSYAKSRPYNSISVLFRSLSLKFDNAVTGKLLDIKRNPSVFLQSMFIALLSVVK